MTLRQFRCCIYQNNITGRFSTQCLPIQGKQEIVCPPRQIYTVITGFTSSNQNTCEICRQIARRLYEINDKLNEMENNQGCSEC